MTFHWLRDKQQQQYLRVFWDRGNRNGADYFTKHHPTLYHKLMRSKYILNLVKSGLRVGKRGKAYNKTNNCIVCKKKNIRRQTTFICGKCNLPLCSPELTEQSKSPRDYF